MKLELNQTIYEINIDKAVLEKSYRKNGIKILEHKIIGINTWRLCINDVYFSKFDVKQKGQRRETYNTYIEDTRVTIRVGDSILGDGIFVKLHTTKKPTKATLKKMVAKAVIDIDSKYGFLFGGVKYELYDFVEQHKI